jgi:hypothetical protein
MTTEFVSVPANYTVAETLKHIREVQHTRETVYAIYVLDPNSRELRQVVSLRQLISADPASNILEVASDRDPIWVDPDVDREEVARLISIHDLWLFRSSMRGIACWASSRSTTSSTRFWQKVPKTFSASAALRAWPSPIWKSASLR